MKIAVIPARGGSKRVPRKNIREFCGKPMIAWSIDAARASGCFDDIIVSTDDEAIATVARDAGASVPFMRPAGLSDDHTPTVPVIAHAVRWLNEQGRQPGQVCCIYATAPFLQAEDIRRGLDILQQGSADYAISVTDYAFPIQRAVRINATGELEMIQPEFLQVRSQDLEPAYHDAGQFYWGTASTWLEERRMFAAGTRPVILPRSRVQDIDTPEDWDIAEHMMNAQES
jgi:N-acylneuraminate cytidylyltransferase